MSDPPENLRAGALDFLPVFGSVIAWGIAPVLIVVIGKAGFDPYTQSFYRYAVSAAFFLAIAAAFDRPGLVAAFRRVRATGAMAVAVVTFQLAYVNGIYLTTPTVAVFAEHSSIVFGLAGGALLFADERRIVLSWRYLAGVMVVAAAAVGVVLGGSADIEGGPLSEGGTRAGGACLFVAAAAWATFSLLIKRFVAGPSGRQRLQQDGQDSGGRSHPVYPVHPVRSLSGGRKLHALPAFAVTMAEASLLMLAAAAIFGDLGHVAEVSGGILVAIAVSGVACVGVGQALYFVSIGRIGVALSQTMTLATPFLAGLFSFTLLGERMSPFQWACGTVLMAGVAYLIWARAGLPPGTGGAGRKLPGLGSRGRTRAT